MDIFCAFGSYYSYRNSKSSSHIWNEFRKNLVETQIHNILGDVDPYGNKMSPNNMCRFCKQRFMSIKQGNDRVFTCYYNLSKEKMIGLLMYTLKHWAKASISWAYIVQHHGGFKRFFSHLLIVNLVVLAVRVAE